MKIGIVGLGEVGHRLASELLQGHHIVVAWDERSESRSASVASQLGIVTWTDPAEFCTDLDLVVVATTAAQATDCARRLLPHISPETTYADWTSQSPEERDLVAYLCDEFKVPFADVALLGTAAWLDQPLPIIASGPGRYVTQLAVADTSFQCHVLGDEPRSAEVKLLRSVFTKGLTALLGETLAAGESAGIGGMVQATVCDFMQTDFERVVELLLGTSIRHAERRWHEAIAAQSLVNSLLEAPVMAKATADWFAQLVVRAPHPAMTGESAADLVRLMSVRSPRSLE